MDPTGLVPLVADALLRVARIAALVAVGVFLANLAVEFGAVERVAGLSRFLTGPANLPDEAGTAILTTTASTTAGYGMLADFRESGRLSDRATLVAVTINTFFGFVQHVFTFYAPVLIPILGLQVGLMYVGARAGIALAITLVGVFGGALLLPSDGVAGRSADDETDGLGVATADESGEDGLADGGSTPSVAATGGSATYRERAHAAADASRSTLRRIVPRLAVVYVLVTVLVARVDLQSLSAAAGPLAEVAGLPAAAIPVIVIFAFDTTAGAATVAPLVGNTLTPEVAVATMLVGGVVSFAVSTFKRSIPFQYGVWGAEFGLRVVVLNTVLKVVFISVAVAFFLV
ncbi:nucleoside recognition protein [Halorarum halobium]|uniref:nucleoside recognition protein n=1 Tax=Halorarum halobium TaxID=3075121 RepID=UPI0028AE5EF1|nr:nucleoside recognition protein [Halobaculum sp. XH14]